MNRGVRTVRRWEAEEGLPVHRQVHKTLGSVYAFKPEIDAWRASSSRQPKRTKPGGDPASIAVLPFADLGADPGNAFFADGLTDEIIADLSTVRALRVTSRTSSTTFKGTTKSLRAIASELGVRYVLEGTVRRTAERLRITARLIDADTDNQVWAGKFDGGADDVFSMQERLARTIVDALEVRLTRDEERRLRERPIADPQAYECYLRARQAWRWRKDAIDEAVRLLQSGLEIIGANARLYAALGVAYLQYREAGIDGGDGPVERAEHCSREVLALDPASAAGRQLRGWIHYARGRIQEAVVELKGALASDPGNADTLLLLCNCYLISGQPAAARPLIDRLVVIDPLTPVTRCMPAWADALEGKWAAAVAPYATMFAMDRANPMARLFYAWVLAGNGRAAEVNDLAATLPVELRDSVPGRLCRVLAAALAGDTAATVDAVDPAVEASAHTSDVFARILAQSYALAGLRERAIQWLQVAVDRGFINHPFLAHHDPFFSRMRDDPPFVRLLDHVRVRWERFQP